MTGKTHIALGIAASLTVSSNLPVEEQLILVGASVIGSLAPDLDHPKAKLNQKLLIFNSPFYKTMFYLILSGISVFLYFSTSNKVFGLIGIVAFLIALSSHRGFTHSIIGFLGFISIVKILALKYDLMPMYSGFTIGYILHLIADFFTPQGIKLFYPLKISVASPITISTSSKEEKALLAAVSIYSVLFLFRFLKI